MTQAQFWLSRWHRVGGTVRVVGEGAAAEIELGGLGRVAMRQDRYEAAQQLIAELQWIGEQTIARTILKLRAPALPEQRANDTRGKRGESRTDLPGISRYVPVIDVAPKVMIIPS